MNQKDFADLWKGMYGPERRIPDLPPAWSDERGQMAIAAVDRENLVITIDTVRPDPSVQTWLRDLKAFGIPLRPRLSGVFEYASDLAHR